MGLAWEVHGTYIGLVWEVRGNYMGLAWDLLGTYMGASYSKERIRKNPTGSFLYEEKSVNRIL